jgi:hypothetical protein
MPHKQSLNCGVLRLENLRSAGQISNNTTAVQTGATLTGNEDEGEWMWSRMNQGQTV